jgi:cellobiose epimerase
MDQHSIPKALTDLAREMEDELRGNILPYWPRFVDREYGGFHGTIHNDGSFDPAADKGLVMHARQLWAYAAASRTLDDPALLSTAKVAYDFLTGALRDMQYGGFFWGVDHTGRTPIMDRKVLYGQAFAVYALSEYARAGGPAEALDIAMETYGLIQGRADDRRHGGYFEACSRDWSAVVSSALSDSDIACDKSMNTNLHVMEALSSLYAATGEKKVRESLRALIDAHLDRILVDDEHLGLYFTADWKRLDSIVSYGHDVEAGWLITEAAERAWGGVVPERVRSRVLAMARGTARVLDRNGRSLPNELRDGRLEEERTWWVQAETIVGMVNAWELSGDAAYLDRALSAWAFVKKNIVDRVNGEWLWGVDADGRPVPGRPKGGFWKAAYHDSRACMEVMTRAGKGTRTP